ncbi:MAG: hypothetical protein K8S87_00965 [Planctomycetes bacterium]|nr:hypothetical protein [Planctomycetota bacterium]
MTEYEVTNDELLDYLRHELDDERRKEIASKLYNDSELQRRFKEIQRIEALVVDNYSFGEVNISSDVEKNVVRYINETIASIISEKEKNILTVKKLIEENEKKQKEKANSRYLISGISWAAAIIICVAVLFNIIADISRKSHDFSIAGASTIKSVPFIVMPPKQDFNPIEMEYVQAQSPKFTADDVIDTNVNNNPGEDIIVNLVPNKVSAFIKAISKFDESEFIKKAQGFVPPVVLKIEIDEKNRGDLNEDGLINQKDLDLLTNMLQKGSAYKLGIPADMDKDNVVTLKDLVLLAKIVDSNTKTN